MLDMLVNSQDSIVDSGRRILVQERVSVLDEASIYLLVKPLSVPINSEISLWTDRGSPGREVGPRDSNKAGRSD